MTDRQVSPATVIETLREMLSAAQLDVALARAALREEMAARDQLSEQLQAALRQLEEKAE